MDTPHSLRRSQAWGTVTLTFWPPGLWPICFYGSSPQSGALCWGSPSRRTLQTGDAGMVFQAALSGMGATSTPFLNAQDSSDHRGI